MVDYILITKFYNERQRLPSIIENISKQTLRPKIFVFINDGSNDESADIAAETATKLGIKFEIVSMPPKAKGNLDTLGRAWNKTQPLLLRLLQNIPYVATVDVDTRFPTDYFENMISFLEAHPDIGVVAGEVTGEPKRTFPMFTGKVFRASIIKGIQKYWDISADSFINVKALRMGYKIIIRKDMKVVSPPTHLHTWKGRFRAGRLAYYTGTSLVYVIIKGISKHDAQYLRGHWSEVSRGTWRCDDKDILEYYGTLHKRKLTQIVKRTLRL
ncbi:MAG: glycosyltransferase family 2 protein [Candidatus Thorarchaeota archaeon]|nr:glycosyltransferase family 2 protein [Candidatus Thorarchaeota archaeon]